MIDMELTKASSNYDKLCSDLTFNEEKAIGVLSYLCRLADNSLDHYKAAKLMYLYDREVLLETGEPAFYGKYFSLPAGPIVSEVNDGIKSCLPDKLDTAISWKEFFKLDDKKNQLSQKKSEDFYFSGLLSDEDRGRLAKLFNTYREFDFRAMRKVMHDLPEHVDLTGDERRKLLTYRHVLEKNGFTSGQIEELLSEIAYENLFRTVTNPIW